MTVYTISGQCAESEDGEVAHDRPVAQNGVQGSFKMAGDEEPGTDALLADPPVRIIISNDEKKYAEAIGGERGTCLIHTVKSDITQKDFTQEVRAMRDVSRYLEKTPPIIDLEHTSMDAIFRQMLEHMLEKSESAAAVEDAFNVLFTQDSVRALTNTIQSSCSTSGGDDIDQSWLCVLCSVPLVKTRYVCVARLTHAANLGRSSQEVRFVILIVTPTKVKGTKNALETGRTFATLFSDFELRHSLLAAQDQENFNKVIRHHAQDIVKRDTQLLEGKNLEKEEEAAEQVKEQPESSRPFAGLISDFKRRLGYYVSDFRDGFVGPRTLQKTASTTFFLYFACLLPCIALGVLNSNNTYGKIDVKKVIYSQTMGGLFFAIFGGQPMVILLTTAPLALYTKVIYTLCEDWDLDFFAMFAATGLWNTFFILIYSFSGASRLMKWSTRSTEEIFALFISVAFTVDAFKDVVKDFSKHYNSCDDGHSPENSSILHSIDVTTQSILGNASDAYGSGHSEYVCAPATSILFLFLMLATVWLGLTIFRFTKTPYLNTGKREILADYALPIAVLFMSFLGSYVFRQIEITPFSYNDGKIFSLAPLHKLSVGAIFGSMGLGFCLSLLFFMDQNISAAMVDTPENRMKKGSAYHWDLFIVALLNGFLTLFGLPMMHGALPHSPLHARAMADTEDRVDQGHVYQRVTLARETRVTAVFAHILIGLSVLLLPYPLSYIPRPVLDGLFLYLAVTALDGNQMFERIMLLFTEQSAYPPNHYIRRVPQRMIHLFTLTQLIQLGVMCGFGFAPIPYFKMVFPVLLLLLLPVRNGLVPKFIKLRYLKAIDGH